MRSTRRPTRYPLSSAALGLALAVIVLLVMAACGEQDATPAGQDQGTPASPPMTPTTGGATATVTLPPSSPPTPTPSSPAIAFPKQPWDTMEGGMGALLTGQLAVVDGCLRVVTDGDDSGQVPIWPPDVELVVSDESIEVVTDEGKVVGRVGEEIWMGGGGIGDRYELGENDPSISRCGGPFWLVNDVRLAAEPQPVPTPAVPSVAFPRTTEPSDASEQLIGTLSRTDACVRLDARDGGPSYLVVWSPEHAMDWSSGSLMILDGDGRRVAWAGAHMYLTGTPAETPDEVLANAQLLEELPLDCPGPYWIAGTAVGPAEFYPDQTGATPLNPDDPALQDMIWAAASLQVPLAVIEAESGVQVPIGQLGATLEANERETFAGLWVERDAEFRVVVAFTRDGEQTIRPYIEGGPLDGLVDVRVARWTHDELLAHQEEAGRILHELGFNAASFTDVKNNRVELWLVDTEGLEAALQAYGMQLPESVVLTKMDAMDSDD